MTLRKCGGTSVMFLSHRLYFVEEAFFNDGWMFPWQQLAFVLDVSQVEGVHQHLADGVLAPKALSPLSISPMGTRAKVGLVEPGCQSRIGFVENLNFSYE